MNRGVSLNKSDSLHLYRVQRALDKTYYADFVMTYPQNSEFIINYTIHLLHDELLHTINTLIS